LEAGRRVKKKELPTIERGDGPQTCSDYLCTKMLANPEEAGGWTRGKKITQAPVEERKGAKKNRTRPGRFLLERGRFAGKATGLHVIKKAVEKKKRRLGGGGG